jgi:ribonuclease Z
MMPLPYRHLTSLAVRLQGSSILIDCGEGTQVALRKKGWSPNPIDVMLFTHYHADHISGLPGMLLSMGNADRQAPVLMIGPKGLARVVDSLRVIAPELPFEIRYRELSDPVERIEIPGLKDFEIEAFRVRHNVVCYGYSLRLSRKGKFNAQAAESLGIPKPYWKRLQNGETVVLDGQAFSPEQVMGATRKGLHVTYTTDTRPCESIVRSAAGADLLICEGMYGEDEKISAAMENRHMTFAEAAGIAKEAGVKELWLTHYSPAEQKPEEHIVNARKIFANSQPGYDGKHRVLSFED